MLVKLLHKYKYGHFTQSEYADISENDYNDLKSYYNRLNKFISDQIPSTEVCTVDEEEYNEVIDALNRTRKKRRKSENINIVTDDVYIYISCNGKTIYKLDHKDINSQSAINMMKFVLSYLNYGV